MTVERPMNVSRLHTKVYKMANPQDTSYINLRRVTKHIRLNAIYQNREINLTSDWHEENWNLWTL